jgi:hypothetical protein
MTYMYMAYVNRAQEGLRIIDGINGAKLGMQGSLLNLIMDYIYIGP